MRGSNTDVRFLLAVWRKVSVSGEGGSSPLVGSFEAPFSSSAGHSLIASLTPIERFVRLRLSLFERNESGRGPLLLATPLEM